MKYIASLKKFLLTELGTALTIAALWQLLFTVIGAGFDLFLSKNPSGDLSAPQTILSHTMRWDAGWYMSILGGSYWDTSSAASVFYPLYPLIIKTAHILTFGLLDYPFIGLLLNVASLALAIFFMRRIALHFFGQKYQWWPVALFITSPVAIFMHFFYTEALFCAVAFGAYYFALKRNWLPMALLLGVLTASRLPSILFVGLCGLEFMRAYSWNIKKILSRNLLYFLVAPVGFILYGLFLYIVRGDFMGMFSGYKLTTDWIYHTFNPNIFELYFNTIKTLYVIFITHELPLDKGRLVNVVLPVAGLTILFISSVYLLFTKKLAKHMGAPLGIAGLVTIVFVSLNSNIVSVHRYMLPCLGIYIAATLLLKNLKRGKVLAIALCAVSIPVQLLLLWLFIGNWFAG